MRVNLYRLNMDSKMLIPFFEDGIFGGFPSPATDYFRNEIDLNEELIRNKSTTFLGRVEGVSMKDIGIWSGSLAIIDRSLEAKNNDLVVAWVDEGFTLKQVRITDEGIFLHPFNTEFKPIKISDQDDFFIWGKVTYIINSTI